MAIAFVQQAKNTALNGTSVAATCGSNTTTGNFIAVFVSVNNNPTRVSVTGISDGTNTYTNLLPSTVYNSKDSVWYAKNITGLVTPTITATVSDSITGDLNIQIIEVAGVDTVQPIDHFAAVRVTTLANPCKCYMSTPELKSTNEFIVVYASSGATGVWTAEASLSNLQSQAGATSSCAMASEVVASANPIQTFLSLAANNNCGSFILTLADKTMPNNYLVTTLNNYQQLKVGDGMGMGEKIR